MDLVEPIYIEEEEAHGHLMRIKDVTATHTKLLDCQKFGLYHGIQVSTRKQ